MRYRIQPWQYLIAVLLTWAVIFSPSASAYDIYTDNPSCTGDSQGSGVMSFYDTMEGAIGACSAASGENCANNSLKNQTFPNGADGKKMVCDPLGFASNRSHTWVFPIDAGNLCPAGDIIDTATGECKLDTDTPPVSCLPVEISFSNEFGEITSCVTSIDPDLDTCANPQGYINDVEICGDDKNQCEAAGGDFGYLNSQPVCVQPEIETAGEYCPSGYVVTYNAGLDGAAGSYNCELPDDLPPTICDATKYDCDGDKNIDDQNKNGCIDNGVADDPLCPNLQPGVPGQDPLQPPVQGAGDCDPTSRNYAKCAGFVDETETEDTRGERENLSSGDSMDEVAGNVYTRLENAPIVQMVSNVNQAFTFTNSACPTPSFNAFGSSFSIDFHCQLYLDIASILSAVMMIIFSIAGIRHIASA